jgi:hypothetical protein
MIMDELLSHLEKQVKALIDHYDQAKQSNQQLHHGKFNLTRQNELLLARQQKAIAQIQHLVSKLKAIERLSHDG